MNHLKAMKVFHLRERMEALGPDHWGFKYLKIEHKREMERYGPLTEANVEAYLRQCEGKEVEPVKDLSMTRIGEI